MNWGPGIDLPVLLTVLMTVFNLVWSQTVQEMCQKKLFIGSGEKSYIRHSAFASVLSKQGGTLCKYEIGTKPGNLIRVHIKTLNQLRNGSHHGVDCMANYIHIGNDPWRVGVEMLTSYKLCQITGDQEVVSRANYVWVIVRSPEPSVFSWLQIHYQSQPKVLCNNTAFECSPVQCIPKTAICDGVQDCDNGRDEYCDSGSADPRTDIPTHEPCFMCGDGSCIKPELPMYSLDWGKHLWYLCDQYDHCPDGADERKDVCYRIKGRAAALFRCTPRGGNVTAYLWNTVVCDGEQDCVGGQDEAADLCKASSESVRAFEPVSIILPLAAVAMVLLGGLAGRAIYRKQDRRISLPASCMDTTYIFTEFSNTPTTVEEEVLEKEKFQLDVSTGAKRQVNPDDRVGLDFDDDLDDDDDLDLDDFDNEDATFTVVTTARQTTV